MMFRAGAPNRAAPVPGRTPLRAVRPGTARGDVVRAQPRGVVRDPESVPRTRAARSGDQGRHDGRQSFPVMAGLVPAIHAFVHGKTEKDVDARDERGHDGEYLLLDSEGRAAP